MRQQQRDEERAMIKSILIAMLLCSLVFISASKLIYSFSTQKIPIINKPDDPFFFDFHMTRYSGGCHHQNEHTYDTIIPWMRNFDLIVTSCGVDWKGSHSGNTPCIFEFDAHDPKRRIVGPDEPKGLIRIHLKADPPYNKFFKASMLPFYENRYQQTGEQIIVHSGGADNSVGPDFVELFMKTKAIKRYVIENNKVDEFVENPKMVQLPIGICPREAYDETGTELRIVMNETEVFTSNKDPLGAAISSKYRAEQRHRLLSTMEAAKQIKWNERKDRVFFCFHHGGVRGEAIDHILKHCDFCDSCNNTAGALPHIELWRAYTQYKFIYSPWGNGFDCGRTWEILLLGAVPVIQYFSGALGYEQGGLHAVTVKNYTDITRENMDIWLAKFKDSNDLYKLQRKYWENRAFGGFKSPKVAAPPATGNHNTTVRTIHF